MEIGKQAEVRLYVRVPKDIKSNLLKAARKGKVSAAEVVRVALISYLKK